MKEPFVSFVIPYVGHRYWQGPQSICRGISFAKAKKAVLDTFEARRLVLEFAAKKNCGAAICAQIGTIAQAIVRWWAREYVAAFKRRICLGMRRSV